MKLITENLDLWTSTIKAKKATGRGSSSKRELYGIKKLRELILELAVRGLLVPRDSDDEPASELLKRIAKEKAQLIEQKIIKKKKALPSIKESEQPFNIPSSWEWIRLQDIGHDWGQKTPGNDFTYIDVSAIDQSQGVVSEADVLSSAEAPSRARKIVKEGTVIYSTVRPYLLNIAVIGNNFEPEPIASTAFAVIHPCAKIPALFIYRYLRSPTFIAYVGSCQKGVAYPAINDSNFFRGIIPLPPLAEQHRIVAKVDELMALCDQLEQQQEDSIDTHETLVKTLLDALTTTSDPPQFQQAWQRIEANFHLLFTTESSIDHLKQTILQLAVMGKLVPQDLNDDARDNFPAWSSHEVKNTKLDSPVQWMKIPLGKLGEWRGGGTPSKGNSEFWNGDIPWVCPKDMKRPIIHNSIDQITTEAIGKSSAKLIPMNSLLMVVRGMILVHSFPVARSGREVTINQDMKSLIPDYLDTTTYLHLSLNALKGEFLNAVERSSHGTCKLLTKDLHGTPIPIPPLAEQHRIVAKVDDLMTFCDTLKAKLQTAQTTQQTLTDSIAQQATS